MCTSDCRDKGSCRLQLFIRFRRMHVIQTSHVIYTMRAKCGTDTVGGERWSVRNTVYSFLIHISHGAMFLIYRRYSPPRVSLDFKSPSLSMQPMTASACAPKKYTSKHTANTAIAKQTIKPKEAFLLLLLFRQRWETEPPWDHSKLHWLGFWMTSSLMQL